MALLVTKGISLAGQAADLVAASGGGDTLTPGDHVVLEVNNGDGTSTNVTLVTPGNDQFGSPNADLVIAVAAGKRCKIGPIDRRFADPADGKAHISYSKVTSLTVGACSI